MGESWVALAVAVVGVAGTLGAAQLTQSRADRTKRLELEALARQQREEREHAERVRRSEAAEARRRERLELRRTCYIGLNTAFRQYQTAQINLVHALRSGDRDAVEECAEQLEESRGIQRESYAEAQMITPDRVMSTVSAAGHQLGRGYGTLKGFLEQFRDDTSPAPDVAVLDEFAAVDVETAWALLSDLRKALRRDLGVDASDDE
ncbi:hypothetical protein ACIQ6Y_38915 [Streptomyces sp. NPDC096205]|uniref:hypothetical protein n=1 Tax=Streptomyces sp. NPDC096205 TaxID=3366081 RepID=UPI0037FEEB5E